MISAEEIATPSMLTDFWEELGVEICIFIATVVFSIGLKLYMSSLRVKPRRAQKVKFEREPVEEETSDAVAEPSPRSKNPDEASVNAITYGDERIALRTWDSLKKKGLRIKDVAEAPLEVYASLIRHAARGQSKALVKQVLDEMVEDGVERTLDFYERAMKLLAGAKHQRLALDMYGFMVKDGFEPSAVTYSCLVSFAAEVGELDLAVRFFNELDAKEVPSIRAYMTILRVHGKRSDWSSSLAVFNDMQRRGLVPDTLVLNILLGTGVALDKVGPLTAVFETFDRQSNPITDLVSYNTILKGLAQRGRVNKVTEVMDRMRQRGYEPNAISFNTAMDAAIRAKDMNKAWAFLQKMREAGFNPDKYSVSILAKGLHTSPSPQYIRDLVRVLKELAPTCDRTVMQNAYQTVVETAVKLNQRDLAVLAFAQMRRDGVTPSPASEKIMAKMSARSSAPAEPAHQPRAAPPRAQKVPTASQPKEASPEANKMDSKATPPWRSRKTIEAAKPNEAADNRAAPAA